MSRSLTKDEFESKLCQFEAGLTVPNWLYLDTTGKITIGIGLRFSQAKALVNSKISFRFRESGRQATDEDIRREFARISTLSRGHLPSYYRRFATILADSTHLNRMYKKKLMDAVSDARFFYDTPPINASDKYKEFQSLPQNVKFALIDMAFNIGRSKLMKYQKLKSALRNGNGKEAARESVRYGIATARNRTTEAWILKSMNS